MREAEASLSLKEMRQRLADMEQQWLVGFKYLNDILFILEVHAK